MVLRGNPGFYNQPKTVAALVDFVVAGILDYLEVSRSPAPPRGPSRRSNSGAARFRACS